MICRTHDSKSTFHVKQLALLIAAIAFAVLSCSCAAQESEKATNTEAVTAAADKVASSEAQYAEDEPDKDSQDLKETFKSEDLPSPAEAREATGISEKDAGVSYVDGEILVTFRGGADVAEINRQLAFCEFIQETRIGNEMMVTGRISEGSVRKGAAGEAVAVLHTAGDVHVNQAIAGLKKTKALRHAEPNYIMTTE